MLDASPNKDDESDDENDSDDEEPKTNPAPVTSKAFQEFLLFLELGCLDSPLQGYPPVLIVLSTIPPFVRFLVSCILYYSSPFLSCRYSRQSKILFRHSLLRSGQQSMDEHSVGSIGLRLQPRSSHQCSRARCLWSGGSVMNSLPHFYPLKSRKMPLKL